MTNRLRVIAVAIGLVAAVALAAAYAMGRHHPTAARPAASVPATSSATTGPGPIRGAVCRTRLPGQAQDTIALIARGGPFPYRSDGIVFDNREGRLPRQPTAYYHEYTVVTPGSADRGARRIVTGAAGEEYWTQDHYASFQRIDAGC